MIRGLGETSSSDRTEASGGSTCRAKHCIICGQSTQAVLESLSTPFQKWLPPSSRYVQSRCPASASSFAICRLWSTGTLLSLLPCST